MNDLLNFTWSVSVTQFAIGALINIGVAFVIVRYIYTR